jgi:hypothetical protein
LCIAISGSVYLLLVFPVTFAKPVRGMQFALLTSLIGIVFLKSKKPGHLIIMGGGGEKKKFLTVHTVKNAYSFVNLLKPSGNFTYHQV